MTHTIDPLERVRHTLLQARCGGAFLLRREGEEIWLDLKWQSYGNEILAALEGDGLVCRRTGEQGVLMISAPPVTLPPLASDPQTSDNTR